MITIYGNDGTVKTQVPCDDRSTQAKELQGDNVLTLSFTLYEHIALDVNDYAEFMGERYWLMEQYKPEQVSTVEWKYDVKFYGVESLVKRFLVLDDTDGSDEAVFTLTAPPREHVALVVASINRGMNTTDWKVGTVEGTDNIVIDYRGTYCGDALKEIAKKTGGRAEWWVEGQTVNICRCEQGEEIALAYNKGLTSLECDMADNVAFYTRLYPLGSTRNIDPEQYGHARLQLPGGVKHVDVGVEKYGVWHRFEESAFSDIYPRYTGTVSSIRTEEKTDKDGNPYTIYYIKDDGLPFDPNEYEIGGKVKRISFQEGSALAGLGNEENGNYYFEANFDSDTREWEIITIWPYGDDTQLPNGTLCPKPGDHYIPWNIRMPDEYYPLAEQEFREAVDDYNAENAIDASRYKAPTDHVYMEEHGIELHIGSRVRLESDKYFPETGFRTSRITKITRRVNLPSLMDLEICDAASTGTMESIGESFADVNNQIRQLAGNFPDLIKLGEGTMPTDNNVFSALRALATFLRKDQPDATQYLLRLLGGAHFGEFASSLMNGTGGSIDSHGNAELETLRLRSALIVKELIYNRWSAQEGNTTFTEAGTIDAVKQEDDGTYTLTIRRRWEYDVTAFDEQDVCYGSVNDLAQGGGHYYDAWFRMLSVNRTANTLSVVLYPDDEVPGGKNYTPQVGMVVTRRGNATNTERQGFWYISSYEGCICFLDGVTKPILEERNYAIIIGKLKRLSLFDNLPINYLHSYVYCRGIAIQDLLRIDYEGTSVVTLNDRGFWSLEVAQGDNPYTVGQDTVDTVWHYGCRWKCLVTGTTDEPRYAATGWAMIEGNPAFTIDIDSSAGWAFDGGQLTEDVPFTTLTVTGTLYNRDVTAHILDDDISWTRDTGNVSEDNAWAIKKAGAGKSLPLVADDLGLEFRQKGVCSFKCTATLRDGNETQMAENIVTF